MKKNKGITLIALVITIVVLIILASVAITLSLGENGVFKKATKAKEDTKVAQNEETMQIAEATNSTDGAVGSSRDEQTTIEELKAEIKELKDNQSKKVILTSGTTEIATTTTWTTRNVDITLNDSIENYDYLAFTMNVYANNVWTLERVQLISTKDINYGTSFSNGNNGLDLMANNRDNGSQMNMFFKNNSTLNIYQSITTISSWSKMRITAIEGIKI